MHMAMQLWADATGASINILHIHSSFDVERLVIYRVCMLIA